VSALLRPAGEASRDCLGVFQLPSCSWLLEPGRQRQPAGVLNVRGAGHRHKTTADAQRPHQRSRPAGSAALEGGQRWEAVRSLGRPLRPGSVCSFSELMRGSGLPASRTLRAGATELIYSERLPGRVWITEGLDEGTEERRRNLQELVNAPIQ